MLEALEPRLLLGAGVVISEFMAINDRVLADEDGDHPDWIELHNAGSAAVNLDGWFLTDTSANLSRWRLPAVTLPADGYLVVFASGKDRSDPAGELHTSFRLRGAGEYLALVRPDGVTIEHAYAPEFPPQVADVSYGLAGEPAEQRYFATPTPGAVNEAGYVGVVGPVEFSHTRGFYDEPFEVTLSCATPGAVIRYTLDGAAPAADQGTVYTGPISVTGTTVLRAGAFKADWLTLPDDVVSETYIFISDVLTQTRPAGYPSSWGGYPSDFEMDPDVVNSPAYADVVDDALLSIPTISIVTDRDNLFDPETGIYMNPVERGVAWERPASVEWWDPASGEQFQINCGLRIQGGFSRKPSSSPKHSFRLLFKADYGPTKLRYPLFGPEAVDRFDTIVLRAGFNNSWIHSNSWNGDNRGRAQYIRDLWTKDVELAMGNPGCHTNYAHLYLNGLYWGLYSPSERPDASFAAMYLGGQKEDYDAVKYDAGTGTYEAADGDLTAYNQMFALANAGVENQAGYEALAEMLDIDAFIDYMILHQWGGDRDWDSHNWYAFRRKPDGKFYYISWDNEFVLIDKNDNRIGLNRDKCPSRLFQQLMKNQEFRIRFADRLHELLFNDGLFASGAALEIWNRRSEQVYEAIVAESARWGDYRRDVAPAGDPWPIPLYTRDEHWQNERDRLLSEYFPYRNDIVIQQYIDAGFYPSLAAPEFNQHGGDVFQGFHLDILAPEGTIYYTLDGSDPRLPGGAVSPSALVFTEPLPLEADVLVKARAKRGDEWSALCEAEFNYRGWPLRLTEIMYAPAGGDATEYLELQNIAPYGVALAGTGLGGAVDFTFPEMELGPGQFVLVVKDLPGFQGRYDTQGMLIAGQYAGELPDVGGRLVLTAPDGEVLFDFNYDDWFPATAGAGYSLSLTDPGLDSADHGLASSWRPSDYLHGTPGGTDLPLPDGSLLINEILTYPADGARDWIELYNPTNQVIYLGGWYLSDEPADPTKYRLPADAELRPGEYMVLTEHDHFGGFFEFNRLGGEAVLAAAWADGTLKGFEVRQAFGPAREGVSFGRHTLNDGDVQFLALAQPTPGSANAAPAVGPVVINELMYHPRWASDEFIELYNLTDQPIPLYDPDHPAHTWKVGGMVSFEFPGGAEIPARGYLVLAPRNVTDPDKEQDFRADNGIPPEVPVYGPFVGMLGDGGGTVTLYAPTAPVPATGEFGYAVIEELTYEDEAPWPERADGEGPSLERLDPDGYGTDPANWQAVHDGGSAGRQTLYNPAPPTVDAGEDQQVPHGYHLSIQLNGTATDDGYPQPTTFTATWSRVSGPDAVVFEDPHSPRTTVSLLEEGTYVLRLTADDGDFVVHDDVTITVGPPLQALPSADRTSGLMPLTVHFAGQATGGLPAMGWPASYELSWTFGDGQASSQDDPVHTYETYGRYVAELTVSDGVTTLSEVLTIVVGGLMGDASGDGKVGVADLNAVADNWAEIHLDWAHGDFTGEGAVGIADLGAVADNYGRSVQAAGGSSAAGGPAPSGGDPLAAGSSGAGPAGSADSSGSASVPTSLDATGMLNPEPSAESLEAGAGDSFLAASVPLAPAGVEAEQEPTVRVEELLAGPDLSPLPDEPL